MDAKASPSWHDLNQADLSAAISEVKSRLLACLGRQAKAQEITRPAVVSAVDSLCQAFALSQFERDILLLCAAVELDSQVAGLCAEAHGDPHRPWPSFGLALATLPDSHWSALSPGAPLRSWRLIEVSADAGLTTGQLRIDERILHYITGIDCPEGRLRGLVEPVVASLAQLPESFQALARQAADIWRDAGTGRVLPALQLCGADVVNQRTIAAAACQAVGAGLSAVSARSLPHQPADLETVIRLWRREAALGAGGLFLDCHDDDGPDAAAIEQAAGRWVEDIPGILVIGSAKRRQMTRRPVVTFDVPAAPRHEQRALWAYALGQPADAFLDSLVQQFRLAPTAISEAATHWRSTPGSKSEPAAARRALWRACKLRARPRLDSLADRVESAAAWEDLVLPETQLQTLRQMATQLSHRGTVYDDWGFAAKGARGLGLSALFAGPSGVGKTMAAEVLANALDLDLYRIDLSQVVNKFIGETEKNLGRLFDAAEDGGSILLFDEADALFGRRSEVKDSHDRYANLEVSYLLQRMEAYHGLAILTTNMKGALDTAFLRRIRFVVQFSFPDAAERAEIWRRVFPPATPTQGLDLRKLSRLSVTGGNIRNIALNAAFLAAGEGAAVRMTHVLSAARGECAKIEKPISEAEVLGWADEL